METRLRHDETFCAADRRNQKRMNNGRRPHDGYRRRENRRKPHRPGRSLSRQRAAFEAGKEGRGRPVATISSVASLAVRSREPHGFRSATPSSNGITSLMQESRSRQRPPQTAISPELTWMAPKIAIVLRASSVAGRQVPCPRSILWAAHPQGPHGRQFCANGPLSFSSRGTAAIAPPSNS